MSPGAILTSPGAILMLPDEILGCAGHLTSPEKKWAPFVVKIFYKYVVLTRNRLIRVP